MSELLRLYEESERAQDVYPPEWHETIKHRVREEAGNRCVRCGHPYTSRAHGTGEWSPCDKFCTHKGLVRYLSSTRPTVPFQLAGFAGETKAAHEGQLEAAWRILTVHHLDGDKGNCRWWNLVPLCQRCHLTIQGKVYMARVWPWEHTQWFRPYVAGYYAHIYLGEELERDEVEERLDELLSLERIA